MINKILLKAPTSEIKYETLVDEWSKSPFVYHIDNIRKYNMTWVHKDIEFEYITEGVAEFTIDGRSFFAEAGQTVCVNCYCTHRINAPVHARVAILMINNQFCVKNGIDVSKLQFDELMSDPHISLLFKTIIEEYESGVSKFHDAAIRAAVLNLLVYISRNYSRESEREEGSELRSFGSAFEYTTRAIDFINKNYKRKLTLEEIAAASGASKYHFLRTFKKVTGYTVTDYINQIRCKSAKEMLMSGEYSVKETALLSGFENLSHFTNTFKKYENALPSDFLKKKKPHSLGKKGQKSK